MTKPKRPALKYGLEMCCTSRYGSRHRWTMGTCDFCHLDRDAVRYRYVYIFPRAPRSTWPEEFKMGRPGEPVPWDKYEAEVPEEHR